MEPNISLFAIKKKSTKLFAINYAFQILPKIRHKGSIDDDDDDA